MAYQSNFSEKLRTVLTFFADKGDRSLFFEEFITDFLNRAIYHAKVLDKKRHKFYTYRDT